MYNFNFLLKEEPSKKNYCLFILLSQIYGLNQKRSLYICKKFGFNKKTKINQITIFDKKKIYNYLIKKLQLSFDLKKLKEKELKKYFIMKHYKSFRYRMGYPVRGQRTHTNASTARKFTLSFFYSEKKLIYNSRPKLKKNYKTKKFKFNFKKKR